MWVVQSIIMITISVILEFSHHVGTQLFELLIDIWASAYKFSYISARKILA